MNPGTKKNNELNASSPGFFRTNLPNALTLLRLFFVPVIIFLILQEQLLLAFGLFAIISITDFLDGYLARRWNVTSSFGRLFDPLADKSLMVFSFLTLGYISRIPLWIVALVIGRDVLILIAGLFVYIFKLPIKLMPILSSKINTFFQIILVGGVLLLDFTFGNSFAIPTQIGFDLIMFLLLWVTALTTLWSGVEYALYFVQELI